MEHLLRLEDWAKWEATLQRLVYDDADMARFLERHTETKAHLEQRRAHRAALDAAAAEAQ